MILKLVLFVPMLLIQPRNFTAFRLYQLPTVVNLPLLIASSNTSCSQDPIPIWLVKSCLDILAPSITNLGNFILQRLHPLGLENRDHETTLNLRIKIVSC